MKIAGTGLSGLVGSRVSQLLSKKHTFYNLSPDTGIDITHKQDLISRLDKLDFDWIFHFAAQTDVDRAETEKNQGVDSLTWKVNVTATGNIADYCRNKNKKLLYISTDYVFEGEKTFYTEDDTPNPQGFYAQTKYEGEKIVSNLNDNYIIIRIANPFRSQSLDGKKDFVHKIGEILSSGREVTAADDQIFVPTFIDDIAYTVDFLITNQHFGLFHVVGSESLSPYNAALLIAGQFKFDTNLVKRTTFSKFFHNRAPRPLLANLKNDRITGYGIRMLSFSEAIKSVKLS